MPSCSRAVSLALTKEGVAPGRAASLARKDPGPGGGHSATKLLCDFGRVTAPPWVSVSARVTEAAGVAGWSIPGMRFPRRKNLFPNALDLAEFPPTHPDI